MLICHNASDRFNKLQYVLALVNFRNTMETIIRDECVSMIDNLLSRSVFLSLMFATTGGFVRFDKLLVERLFDLLFGDN